jgi:hypothetical protein
MSQAYPHNSGLPFKIVARRGLTRLGKAGSSFAHDSTHPILTTEQETSQPNRTALEYWADGLEPVLSQALRDDCCDRGRYSHYFWAGSSFGPTSDCDDFFGVVWCGSASIVTSTSAPGLSPTSLPSSS